MINLSIDPIGPARMRYRKKLDKARKKEIKRLRYAQLLAIKKGKLVPVRIPIYHIPKIKYGPWAPSVGTGLGEEGEKVFPSTGEGGSGREGGTMPIDAIYGEELGKKELIAWMKEELELEFLKPAKTQLREKLKYPAISKRGDASLLDLDETIEAMIERQVTEKKLKPETKMKIKIEEEDLRYRFPKITYKTDRDAILIFIRDVSGSITPQELELSYALSLLIQLWLEECYPRVEMVYIAHNAEAWEDTEYNYYRLRSGGGTAFIPTYTIIRAMFEGKDYPRKTPRRRKITPDTVDIYVVQMTDGENTYSEREEAINVVGLLLNHVTRFCYLEERSSGYGTFATKLKEKFPIDKLRLARAINMEEIWDAMRKFFGRKTG